MFVTLKKRIGIAGARDLRAGDAAIPEAEAYFTSFQYSFFSL